MLSLTLKFIPMLIRSHLVFTCWGIKLNSPCMTNSALEKTIWSLNQLWKFLSWLGIISKICHIVYSSNVLSIFTFKIMFFEHPRLRNLEFSSFRTTLEKYKTEEMARAFTRFTGQPLKRGQPVNIISTLLFP